MPLDLALIKTIRQVLANNQGRDDLTEEIIAIDAEVILRRPIATHLLQAALAECLQRGWARKSADPFGFPTWSAPPNPRPLPSPPH